LPREVFFGRFGVPVADFCLVCGSDISSTSISPQVRQLHIAAQAALEAGSTGVVNLAFQPRPLLMD
jgi:hypothetical protein